MLVSDVPRVVSAAGGGGGIACAQCGGDGAGSVVPVTRTAVDVTARAAAATAGHLPLYPPPLLSDAAPTFVDVCGAAFLGRPVALLPAARGRRHGRERRGRPRRRARQGIAWRGGGGSIGVPRGCAPRLGNAWPKRMASPCPAVRWHESSGPSGAPAPRAAPIAVFSTNSGHPVAKTAKKMCKMVCARTGSNCLPSHYESDAVGSRNSGNYRVSYARLWASRHGHTQ